jgi:hypothetical protein
MHSLSREFIISFYPNVYDNYMLANNIEVDPFMRNFSDADIHNNSTEQDNGSNNNMEQDNGSNNDKPMPDKDKSKEEPAVDINETIVPFFDSAFSICSYPIRHYLMI